MIAGKKNEKTKKRGRKIPKDFPEESKTKFHSSLCPYLHLIFFDHLRYFLFFFKCLLQFWNIFFWASSRLWNLGLGLEIGSRNNSDSNPLLCKKISTLVVEVWFICVQQQRRRSEWEGKGQPQWSRRGSVQLQEIEAAATAAVGELWRPMSSARLLKQSVE